MQRTVRRTKTGPRQDVITVVDQPLGEVVQFVGSYGAVVAVFAERAAKLLGLRLIASAQFLKAAHPGEMGEASKTFV